MTPTVLGLDIGGANLKAATSTGLALTQSFPLWKDPAGLASALTRLLELIPRADLLAVTMTGELCDCYESKRQGALAILDAVEAVAGATATRVWRNDGQFVALAAARTTPLDVAAANWLALATFAGRYVPTGSGLLIDVGSTTTDIVPLHDGLPIPRARIDPERLRVKELLYQGVRRTPLCALTGEACAAELFATTLDVHLLLGYIADDDANTDTADGRAATCAAAHVRIARMLCADLETSTEAERLDLARRAFRTQTARMAEALQQVMRRLPLPPRTLVSSGSGEFLARAGMAMLPRLSECQHVSLTRLLGAEVSQAACAYALAMLASERSPQAWTLSQSWPRWVAVSLTCRSSVADCIRGWLRWDGGKCCWCPAAEPLRM